MKLLILEDCAAVHMRLLAMLGGDENLSQLVIAGNAHDVVDKIHQIAPDAAVLDLPLGDGNGLETLRAIKYISPTTKVFFCSNQTQYRDKVLAAGADAFFARALEFDDLVDRLLLLRNQLPRRQTH